jgi:hypothetical protein
MKRKLETVKEPKNKKQKTIQTLNDDLLNYTFQFLHDFELNIVRYTSKRFLKVSNDNNIWKSLNFSKMCLYRNQIAQKLQVNKILSFFDSINKISLEKISFRSCQRLNVESLVKIVEKCPKLSEISLVLCRISVSELIYVFEKFNFPKLKKIELGIMLDDEGGQLLQLEEILFLKGIEIDCSICRNCEDRVILKSVCCSFCRKLYCLKCSFTLFCSSCLTWECNTCSLGWDFCDNCANIYCSKSQKVSTCVKCSRNTCKQCFCGCSNL